jgi:hypothetical protein
MDITHHKHCQLNQQCKVREQAHAKIVLQTSEHCICNADADRCTNIPDCSTYHAHPRRSPCPGCSSTECELPQQIHCRLWCKSMLQQHQHDCCCCHCAGPQTVAHEESIILRTACLPCVSHKLKLSRWWHAVTVPNLCYCVSSCCSCTLPILLVRPVYCASFPQH